MPLITEVKLSKRIIVALDFDDAAQALRLLEQLDPQQCRVKIGKELFTACGPELVQQVIARGFDVFLDLKFHDIPTTVSRAVQAAAKLGVWMINVHASGGRDMMEQSRLALEQYGERRPLLIAVTVLTSMARDDLIAIGVRAGPAKQVVRLAELALSAGLDGVVCSAEETRALRKQFGPDFCLVTPGIRRAEDAIADQKRVVGPAEAVRNGSDFLVIGRPITRAESPAVALQAFNSALVSIL